MKRPMLISSITMAIVCAFLMLFSKFAAVVTVMLAVSVFIIYLIKPLKLRKYIIIPAICISAVLISVSFLAYTDAKIEPCLQYDGETAYISGKVISTPVSENGYTTFTIKADNISGKKESLKLDVKLTEKSAEDIKLYDFVSMEEAEISVLKNENNRPDITYAADGIILSAYSNEANILWHSERTPFYYCLRFKEIIAQKIDGFMHTNPGGLLKGMLFGDSGDIEYSTLKAFRSSGIAHLLAVSGLHTSLWCGMLILLLKLLRIPEKVRNIVCIIFLIAFCTISAFTPSVIRASLMMFVVLIAPFFKRKPDSLNSLGFAVILLLLCNPYIIMSVSFQLSVTSTLGVLLASNYEKKIHSLTQKIKIKPIKSVTDYILCSLLISISAGIFTLPVSAYYFNVFSVISPLTNIFCVKLAFYGMLSGTVATALSFIDNFHIKNIAIFIFDITECILNAVDDISKTFSSIKYCTIPVHKEWLIFGLITAVVIVSAGFILSRLKHSEKAVKVTVFIAVVSLFINISVPVLPTRYSNTLTVLSAGNNMHVIIRSGTHYMYIVNAEESVSTDVYDYLPKATAETFDYYLVTYLSYNAVYDLRKIKSVIEPSETHITPSIKYVAESKGIEFPENTIVSTTGEYTLNSKINVEIIDTYPMQYVIIKGNEKTVYIHLHGDTNFKDVIDTTPGDIFIYNGTAPTEIPPTAETVIINSDSSIITDKNLLKAKEHSSDFFLTAEDGDVQIII